MMSKYSKYGYLPYRGSKVQDSIVCSQNRSVSLTCSPRESIMIKHEPLRGGAEDMFLDVKELAVRKLRIRKTYAPGSVDFHSSEIKQLDSLEVTATAELLEGQIRVEGQLDTEKERRSAQWL